MKICNTENKIYNEARRSYIDLKEGEEWCPRCHGKGYDIDKYYYCPTCRGVGKLDWISRATAANSKADIYVPEKVISQLAEHFKQVLDNEILEKLFSESNKK